MYILSIAESDVNPIMDIVWDDDEYMVAVALAEQAELNYDDLLMADMDVDVITAVPHGFGTGSRAGKAPNVVLHRVFYSHLLFQEGFWGDEHNLQCIFL